MTNFETIKKQAVAIMRSDKHAIRAWAKLAAPKITFDEWTAIIRHCGRVVGPPRGGVTSSFEEAFEGLQLKDGTRVYA